MKLVKGWLGGGGVAAGFVFLVWLTHQAPLWFERDAKSVDAFRGQLVQLFGYGIAAAVAIYGIKKYLLDKEKQQTDTFSAAVGHLGSTDPIVRAGGVRELERIMEYTPADSVRVVETLTDFLHQHTALPDAQPDPEAPPPIDIAAALTALCRRRRIAGEPPLQLARCRIPRAQLDNIALPAADLTDAELPHATLRRAELTGADLSGADLAQADLTGAQLRGARLTGARLIAARLTDADLTDADLTGAVLDDADLCGADLRGAIGLDDEQLARARTDHRTRLPSAKPETRGPSPFRACASLWRIWWARRHPNRH